MYVGFNIIRVKTNTKHTREKSQIAIYREIKPARTQPQSDLHMK